MVFIKTTALLSLLALVSSKPVDTSVPPPSGLGLKTVLTLGATGSPTEPVPWNDGSINANGSKFWIGKKSLLECTPKQPCDGEVDKAQFVLDQDARKLSLNVNVLGSQQVYIASDGSLSYLGARDPLPETKTNPLGWGLNQVKVGSDAQGLYHGQAWAWLACPVTSDAKATGPWQIFANTRQFVITNEVVPSKNKEDCTYFLLETRFFVPLWYQV